MKRGVVAADTEGLTRGAVLAANNYLFLKIAIGVAVAAVTLFLWHSPAGGPAGDTWLGYGLGTISAALVLWLAYFGIRKRRYAAGRADLRTWLAAHIYVGVLVVILATLHSGFRIGFSLHGSVWLLLVLTVCSGIFGLQAYIRYPSLINANRGGVGYDTMLAQIADLDSEMRQAAMQMDDSINRGIHMMTETTVVGNGIWQRLTGKMPNCPTSVMRQEVEERVRSPDEGRIGPLRRLLGLLTRKETLLARVRREQQLLAWLQIWLMFHVPLSCGLLAAITAHVIAVFFLR